MSSECEKMKPTPPVPPTDSVRLSEHEKTVGTRTLEQDPVDVCNCGGTIHFLERYTASTDRPGVTYGPAFGTDGYVLAVTTDDGRVEIVFPEGSMYSLWTEIKDCPWPDRDRPDERNRMIRQVVHAANGADVEMLRNALEAFGVPEDER